MFGEMRGQDLLNSGHWLQGAPQPFPSLSPVWAGAVFSLLVSRQKKTNKPKSPWVYDMQNLEKIIEEHRNNGFNDAHTAQL